MPTMGHPSQFLVLKMEESSDPCILTSPRFNHKTAAEDVHFTSVFDDSNSEEADLSSSPIRNKHDIGQFRGKEADLHLNGESKYKISPAHGTRGILSVWLKIHMFA
jgi:hypothetical protein